MKRLIGLFLLSTVAAFATPDCIVYFGGGGGTSFHGTGTVQYSNQSKNCYDWRISYFSLGFSALSISVQSGPDVGGAPGTWVSFTTPEATNPIQGVNPNTNIVGASSYFRGAPPWIRVNVTAVTGSGTITGVLYGCQEPGCGSGMQSAAGGGGGAVNSVFGRTGTVIAVSGDYTVAQVTNAAALNAANSFTSAATIDLGATTALADFVLPTDASYVNGDCPTLVSSAGKFSLGDSGSPCAAGSANQKIRPFGGSFDGGGTALSAGKTTYFTFPIACTISAYNILVDTGTVSFDIWKIATGTAIPTVTNTIISGTSYLAISTGTALHSTTTSALTTTMVAANDIFGIHLQAVSSATFAQLIFGCNAI